MARRRKRRARRGGTKKHRLTLIGRRISPRSRIARRMRGAMVNPRILGMALPKISGDVVNQLIGMTAGYVAVKAIPQIIFPASWRVGIMDTVSKVATVFGVTMVSGMVLRNRAMQNAILVGGLFSVAIDLLSTVSPIPLKSSSVGYIMPPSNKLVASNLGVYQVPENQYVQAEEDERIM